MAAKSDIMHNLNQETPINKKLLLAITAVIIICNCGGTNTSVGQLSEENVQKIHSNNTVVNNTLLYAYRISQKYTESVPSTFTNAKVAGEYGTVTFSGTSSETNNRIILILSSTFQAFGTWTGAITESQSADTISLDKNSKQLLEYSTQLQSCSIDYLSGTGAFIGTIRFNPITISKQTDTTTTFTTPYQITGLLQASSYKWNLDENKTFTTTFKIW